MEIWHRDRQVVYRVSIGYIHSKQTSKYKSIYLPFLVAIDILQQPRAPSKPGFSQENLLDVPYFEVGPLPLEPDSV